MISHPLSQYTSPQRSLLFQCPGCKELTTLSDFSTSAEGVAICCRECSQIFFYPVSSHKEQSAYTERKIPEESTAKETTVAIGSPESPMAGRASVKQTNRMAEKKDRDEEKICVKCGATSGKLAAACRHCGLVFANVGVTFRPSSRDTMTEPHEKAAWMLWDDVCKNWDDSTLHDKFLQYGMAHEMFEFVSLRYREAKEKDGQYADMAQQQLGKVVELVQQQFLIKMQRDESGQQRVKSWKMVLVVLLLMLGLVAFYIIWRQAFAPSQVVLP